MADSYSLQNLSVELPRTLRRYIEAQYHIWDTSLVDERRRLLTEEGVISRAPFIEATPAYMQGETYQNLNLPPEVKAILSRAAESPSTGVPRIPYTHQAEALESFFREKPRSGELVISTGTGSGKTESFLMPVIGSLAIERSRRPTTYEMAATRAILLYPMNALVNDQVARLRRLLGSFEVSRLLERADGQCATFGFYTSRTMYAGSPDAARTKSEVGGWIKKFYREYAGIRRKLLEQGKWPAKYIGRFRNNQFTTSLADRELLTREEMQRRPPDVLVTNYSMLEYMLLRPVDAAIFDRTKEWLEQPDTFLTVVLDEAHLYQGAQGSEVALLLRRLRSRLRVGRDRIRFILTSASLAKHTIREFAAQLTGTLDDGQGFDIVEGKLDKPSSGGPLSARERSAFAKLEVTQLNNAETDFSGAQRAIDTLSRELGSGTVHPQATVEALRDAAFTRLCGTRPHSEIAACIMAQPVAFSALARQAFGDHADSEMALDGVLAALAFARRASDGRVLLPSRAHMLFRGLNGVHACTNPRCEERRDATTEPLLGRLYSEAQLHCACGHRVYELLTHRECGAAYLRAYYDKDNRNFLWHEPSTGAIARSRHLREVHLLVEHSRDRQHQAEPVWLHTPSGRLLREAPTRDISDFLMLKWPPTDGLVPIAGREVLTFPKKCPVCLGTWKDPKRPGIMDLVTKGEDPFAHLIAAQVRLQPAAFAKSPQNPNAGRKSLLFSDGRQKAARLALDVPRVLELDAFRQTILCAAEDLTKLNKSTNLKTNLYASFVAAASEFGLSFFDGDYAAQFSHHVRDFRLNQGGDLALALGDDEPWNPTPPVKFRVELMRLLGSRHYSLFALGLGYVAPTRKALARLQTNLAAQALSSEDVKSFTTFWIDKLLSDFSLYEHGVITRAARVQAAGHRITEVGSRSGISRDQRPLLRRDIADLDAVEAALFDVLTRPAGDSADLHLLDESQLVLVPAHAAEWFRCRECTYLAPIRWRGRCAWCGADHPISVPPGGDSYVKARKEFWRAPVTEALARTQVPFTLDVQEHTAQLNYRDARNARVESTTEEYERRFRDILRAGERSIDVLSCTTTMEVGIDIGSLIAVGLRNMPPSRHNYQQRAGRAGRRGSAVSTVVTFAQHNPHDAYLFDHPAELISGPPRPAGLDVNNPTIVKRHANAELIQEYFNNETIREAKGNIFATLGKTETFYSDSDEGTLADLTRWLSTDHSQETRARLGQWLPRALGLSPEECATSLIASLNGMRKLLDGGLPKDEEDLIEFLFAHGVLPAYAFPRDLIALEIEEDSATPETRERPQQGAGIALSEYAPGRTVVVNKKKYRIGAVTAGSVKSDVDRAVPMFHNRQHYFQCAACLCTRNEGVEGSVCEVCRLAPMDRITVLQPQVVWPERGEEVDELDDETTFTDTTVAQLPIPASNDRFTVDEVFGKNARRKFGRLVPLVVVNRGLVIDGDPQGFNVCKKCGFVSKAGESFPNAHERCYRVRGARSRNCTGTHENVYLGYSFATDVSLLHVPLIAPFASDLVDPTENAALQAAAHSLSNALAIVAAAELGIDQRELQCGHRLGAVAGGDAALDVYVYDTLAGGAGYSWLVGKHFDSIFEATIRRLGECTCQTSCTKCLQTYSNRMSHSLLDRRLALDLARYAKSGSVPDVAGPPSQWDQMQPLAAMLRLDGWTVTRSEVFGGVVVKGKMRQSISVLPALLSRAASGPLRADFSVTDFQLKKDLPSCLLDRPR